MTAIIKLYNTNYARWQSAEKLKADGYVVKCNCWIPHGSTTGEPYHAGLLIETIDDNGCMILYSPAKDTFRILGKARIRYHNARYGYDKIVEDAEFSVPGPRETALPPGE